MEGSGALSVSLHGTIFNTSNGLNNAADLLNIMKDEARIHFTNDDQDMIQPTPYLLHMEYYSRGDHDLRRVFNKISLLGLFLNGNMDKLVATRGCHGISYLNTVGRVMSLLNTGLSSLSLSFDPETD